MDKLIYLVPLMGIIGLLYTFVKSKWVSKQEPGTDRMKQISRYIAEGAMAFLKAEWKILGYFVVIVALLLGFMASTQSPFPLVHCRGLYNGCYFECDGRLYWDARRHKSKCPYCACGAYQPEQGTKSFLYRWFGHGTGRCRTGRTWTWRSIYYIKTIFAPEAAVNSEEMLRTIEVLTGFSLGLNPSHFLPAWAVVSIQKLLMLVRIWWEKWKQASRKMIREIRPPSQTMWEIM